jgi:uncharacterized protein (TIGR03067 family)
MKLRLIPALCVVVLLAADKKEEKDELEGTWVPQSTIRDGEKGEDPPEGAKVIFKNGTATFFVNDKTQATIEYKADPSQKPKAIDITPTTGPEKGTVIKAIYEVDGDTLRICGPTAEKANNRPTKLASEKGSGFNLMTLKREKK